MMLTPMQEIKQRLIALGVPREKILGCTEAQIDEVMQAQGVSHLPEIYLDFLRVMGRGSGMFLATRQYHYPMLLESKHRAIEELQEAHPELTLPNNVFVFYCHEQYYTFDYFDAEEKIGDTDFYQYLDGRPGIIHHDSLLDHFKGTLSRFESHR